MTIALRMTIVFRMTCILLLTGLADLCAAEPDYLRALHPRDWSFPRDHGRHDGYKTEWWFFTGNLRAPDGHRLGYQLTFFRTAYSAAPTTRPSPWAMTDLYFAHAAISDIGGQTFTFKDHLQRGRPGLAETSDKNLDVSLLDWSAKLDDRGIHLLANEPGFTIDLTCTPTQPPVLEGEGGVNAKGRAPGQASYYYSLTRMTTKGTLEAAGRRYEAEGLSWMDHEFSSNALSKEQVGWDWMGLTMADGSGLMIYRLRNAAGGTDYLSGTRIAPDGNPTYLKTSDLSLVPSKPWKSAASGANYPQEWKLTVPGRTITVRSLMPGQELLTPNSTNVDYFEGAVDVVDDQGRAIGEGYLEMTGYAKALGRAL